MVDGRNQLLHALGIAVVAGVALSACARTSSIQALPPRPAAPIDTSALALEEAGLARIDVALRISGTALPEDIGRIRLRPTEVRLHERGGSWVGYPATGGAFTISGSAADTRRILSMQVVPTDYDSVEVAFGDLYVEFDGNAGGPLTRADPPRSSRYVAASPALGTTTTVTLTLNPGASVFQDAACSWHFLPFLTVEPGP